MRKVVYISIAAVLLMALLPASALAQVSENTISPKILAGQTDFAGVVKITGNADGTLTFAFMLRGGAGYCMTDAAIHLGLSLDDFPQNSGGAIPGQFDYKYDFDGKCVTGLTTTIPAPGGKVDTYIAVHVNVILPDGTQETGWVVRCGDLEGAQFPGSNWSAWILYPARAWAD